MGGSAEGSQESQPIHPDARAGAGGAGNFRDANSFLNDDTGTGSLRHSRGAAGRLLLAQATVVPSSSGAGGTAVKKNPPPRTKTLTKIIYQKSNSVADIKISVRVRSDRKNVAKVPRTGAMTRVFPTGGVKKHDGIKLSVLDDGSIHKVKQKLVIRGTYTIRTSYGRKAKPSDVSKYGRGTTAADKAKGDITLGFHESCHGKEYLDYVLNTPFPEFKGDIKMSASDLVDAVNGSEAEFQEFEDDLLALGDLVDEVGYKKSKCFADGKCK